MVKKITYEQYDKIGEQFNEIIDKITHLEVDVSNYIGKTKAHKKVKSLVTAKESISNIRFQIEEDILNKYPNAPLITSFRKYRGEKDYNNTSKMDNNTSKMDNITSEWMK